MEGSRRWRAFGAGVVAAILAAAAATPAAAAPVAPDVACRDESPEALLLEMKVKGEDTFGYYALPKGPPKGLVVFAHGHGNSAFKWRENVVNAARRDGVIAVAMDYRGQTYPFEDPHESFGWRVREGAQDSIAAAKLFASQCKPLRTIVMYGISMGGNTAGLAVAARAERPGTDRRLFDYWFNIEGATNVTETYLEARTVAGPPLENSTAKQAVMEIEQEMGGTIEERPQVYAHHTVVTRARDIKASGIAGVVMVHALDDGQVPYNQSAEMYARLLQVGIPTHFFTVATRGDTPSGTTLEDTTGLAELIPDYPHLLVGHGGENELDHLVTKTSFDRLAALYNRGVAPTCHRKFLVDGTLGTTVPSPNAVARNCRA